MLVSLDKQALKGSVDLVRSKSIANRLLIIQALSANGFNIKHCSNSQDSVTLQKLLSDLKSEDGADTLDVGPAGTCYRFLTAYLCLQKGNQVLTGTERMLKRPIGPLVDALRILGADIEYLGEEGYPPLRIGDSPLRADGPVDIKANISSQFITALLLIAPYIQGGLDIRLKGPLASRPYLEMTLALMRRFNVNATLDGDLLRCPEGTYHGADIEVESDWSAASYFYGLAALLPGTELHLKGLELDSIQGDHALGLFMEKLGVETHKAEDGLLIRSSRPELYAELFEMDFSDIPDTAQTMAVVFAMLEKEAVFSGLESLRIKETDRIAAIQNELAQTGVSFRSEDDEHFYIKHDLQASDKGWNVKTYEDHRMAMAFALLATQKEVFIEDPAVVGKSFPDFWKVLEELGFNLKP